MKVSIFTPTHNPQFLSEVYESIKEQDFFEWIILHNNGSQPIDFEDRRVVQLHAPLNIGAVGFYKRMACEACSGDILLELDHDDLLMPTAIAEVKKAFEDDSIGFVYSNTARTGLDLIPEQDFDISNGWEFRDFEYKDKTIRETIAFEPTPASVSRIWFAPDHLRAFRKTAYDKIGGYNPNMQILDDLELMCRIYCETKFYHINKPLYIYRVHGRNSWLKYNDKIQSGVYPIYYQYIESMIDKWADDRKLIKLDLGGRLSAREGYTTVDLKDADVVADLNSIWPFDDSSIGAVRAFDVFEHLANPIHVMKELQRVLVPGGYAIIQVPSTDGRGAFQDPTHVSFWNENSFFYYTKREYAKYIDTPVRFQPMQIITTPQDNQGVCWVQAHLVNLKDGFRPPGPIFI